MTGIKLVNDAHALLSMRDSDFDAYSAYGEAIDNSIQENATKISVLFDSERGRNNYEHINEVAFVDNGDGMSPEVIHRCLQLGYSSRFNDRSGIGRFGVGMTLGGIHECQRIEVYSKEKGGDNWLWTFIDLSKIDSCRPDPDPDIDIPEPVVKEPPINYLEKIDRPHGTIVIWKKYDRQSASASKLIEETRIWIGRTYRFYIWDGIEIFINSEKIFAIDPLYNETKLTKFPEDSPSEIYEPIIINWPAPLDVDHLDQDESEIQIRISFLPEELRPNRGAGNKKETIERYIDRNQGISIVRKNREVFYGPIPFWPGKTGEWFNEIDRWWGCEIHFEPILDRAFTVKNIKRGAVPELELKRTIFDKIGPTIRNIKVELREFWDKVEEEKKKNEKDNGEVDTGHSPAETVVKETTTDKTHPTVTDPKKAEEELISRLKDQKTTEEKQAWLAKWRSQPFSIEDDFWKSKEFMELKPLGGNDVLLYNTGHPFISELYTILGKLQEKEDSEEKELAIELKCLIDLLLISHTKAETKFEPKEKMVIGDYNEMLNMNWGQYLQNYLNSWRDPDE